MKSLRYVNSNLDTVDRKLLDALINNARTSNAELARLVGLSAPSVTERIRRLEDSGIIGGYTIKVDPTALGLPISVWLRVRPMPGEYDRVVAILQNIKEVVQCDRVTGEDCFLAKAHLNSVAELETLIDKLIPFAMTNTSLIQSSPVTQRLPKY